MKYGFFKTACASLMLKIAQPSYNKIEIIKAIDEAEASGAKLLVTPELSITGATCGDLFFTSALLKSAENALCDIAEQTESKDIAAAVGIPVSYKNKIYNCTAILLRGKILGIIPKMNLSSNEKRFFTSGKNVDDEIVLCGQIIPFGQRVFDFKNGVILGVEIGEELFAASPESSKLAVTGANVIINPSAYAEYAARADYRERVVSVQSAKCNCAYIHAGASIYESTTDLVFSGASLIAENGDILASGERFLWDTNIIYADIDIEKLACERRKNEYFENSAVYCSTVFCEFLNDDCDVTNRFIEPFPFIPSDKKARRERCAELFMIQATALARRMKHIGSTGAVIGISGGLDSTLALLVSVKAMKLLGKDNSEILGVTMPGFGTTDRTYNNALKLMECLGVTVKEISIKNACIQHMSDIEHDLSVHDITYENTQARERTQILFDLANKYGKLLVGTGDLSELAMGWCTFNGDHMCMYGVNASIPKTLVRYLVDYVAGESDKETADILYDILDTPVSPELLPPDKNGKIVQKTEDNIGPYELHDFFLYHFMRFGFSKEKLQFIAEIAFDGKYSSDEIDKWLTLFLRRFFISQFKRNCIPEAPKTGSVGLSPRGDWNMPSDASFADFI